MKKSLGITLSCLLVTCTTALAQTPAEKLGWQLAVHSYTFKQFSIFDAIDKTASLGLTHMSVSGGVNLVADGKLKRVLTPSLSGQDFSAIQARMKEKGIDPKFVNMGVVTPTVDEAESRKLFEAAKRLGIDTLVAEPVTHNKMEELAPVMDVVEKLAKEYHIKVAIHNHPGPKNFYWNPDTVLAAVKGRSPLLGACPDVGCWVRSGLDPVVCLKKLEGRVITLHFKDLNEIGLNAHDVPWGTGVNHAREMLAELKRQNFHGAICIEYDHDWENSLLELAESVKFFNTTCGELAK